MFAKKIFKRHKEYKPKHKARVHTPYVKKETPILVRATSTDSSNDISNKKPPKYKRNHSIYAKSRYFSKDNT